MRIGVDLGGTKISGICLDDVGGVVAYDRVATRRGDYDGVVAQIRDLVERMALAAGQSCTVGIGMPGSVSPISKLVQNANSTWINGRPFQRDLEAALDRPVRLANDANCLVLSEARDGAAAGHRHVFGVILGTGCGGAVIHDGKLVQGRHAIAGEWGHNPLPWPRRGEYAPAPCWCGRVGCLETWISGPALARDHARETGENIAADRISQKAGDGDAACLATLERHLDRCARGLAHVVNVLDPEVIVIGGGLCNLHGLVDGLPSALAPYVFSDAVDITVRAARHGADSGVRGAARLWDDNEELK